MAESFVDLTYRGLSLGRRVKLADVRPTTGYVEVPAPMPVGTAIGILTDDTVALDAVVVEVHEQTAGSSQPPGMVVRPKLDGEAAKAWWQQRIVLPEEPPPTAPTPIVTAPPPVVVVSRRNTKDGIGVPELIDDGRDTGVMDAVIDVPAPDPALENTLQDDGKKTTAMDIVDLKALGLDTGSKSGELPVAKPADDDDGGGDGNGNGNGGDKPDGKAGATSRKRRKRR